MAEKHSEDTSPDSRPHPTLWKEVRHYLEHKHNTSQLPRPPRRRWPPSPPPLVAAPSWPTPVAVCPICGFTEFDILAMPLSGPDATMTDTWRYDDIHHTCTAKLPARATKTHETGQLNISRTSHPDKRMPISPARCEVQNALRGRRLTAPMSAHPFPSQRRTIKNSQSASSSAN
jgi:hypothetical protein